MLTVPIASLVASYKDTWEAQWFFMPLAVALAYTADLVEGHRQRAGRCREDLHPQLGEQGLQTMNYDLLIPLHFAVNGLVGGICVPPRKCTAC